VNKRRVPVKGMFLSTLLAFLLLCLVRFRLPRHDVFEVTSVVSGIASAAIYLTCSAALIKWSLRDRAARKPWLGTGQSVQNYGTAVTGIVDQSTGGAVAIPVEMTVASAPVFKPPAPAVYGEGLVPFQNQQQLASAPPSALLSLTATATPTPGTEYNVYAYDHFSDVPTGNFNTAATKNKQNPAFTIPSKNSGHWSQTFSTNLVTGAPLTTADTQVLRIVPVNAP